jgi:hypothetical protein
MRSAMPAFPIQRPRRRSWVYAVAIACLLLCGSASAASASATVTFRPTFGVDAHLGEGTTWMTELTFSGSEYHGHVDPLTSLTLHLPAGTGLSDAGFATCSKETIEQHGWGACPSGSLAGSAGSLTALFPLGTETLEDQATVQPVFGPGEALYFVVEAPAPVPLELILEGHYASDSPPYGHALALQIPRIEAVPGSPYMSITALTLNVGATREEAGMMFYSVTMPSECSSGFAWAANAEFNEEPSTTVSPFYTGSCPGSGSKSPTTTSLSVSNAAPAVGETVSYTATVTPTDAGGPAPSGEVAFLDGGVPIEGCTAALFAEDVSSSTVTCRVNYATSGVHRISAAYGGDANYLGSSSATETVTVSSPTKETTAPSGSGSSGSSPSTTSSSTGSGGGSTTTATISSAQVAALLGQQLIPSGKAAKIGALLKVGGLTMSFTALEAGTLSVGWYEVPAGAKLAKNSKAKPVLVASGQMTFSAAGTGKLKIRLTAAGKRLLREATRVTLTAKGVFTPVSAAAVRATKDFIIK